MSDELDAARRKIETRLVHARGQLRAMALAAPSRAHYGGVIAGLEEALELLRQS
jgi:hypothetical protein